MSATGSAPGPAPRNGSAPASAPAAAPAAAGSTMAEKMKSVGSSGWVAVVMFIVGIGFLIANLGYMASLAGSSDTWDSVKTQMGGAAAMAFIGALGFMVALLLYFRSFNADLPVYIVTVIACLAIAISLTALSVAAITR